MEVANKLNSVECLDDSWVNDTYNINWRTVSIDNLVVDLSVLKERSHVLAQTPIKTKIELHYNRIDILCLTSNVRITGDVNYGFMHIDSIQCGGKILSQDWFWLLQLLSFTKGDLKAKVEWNSELSLTVKDRDIVFTSTGNKQRADKFGCYNCNSLKLQYNRPGTDGATHFVYYCTNDQSPAAGTALRNENRRQEVALRFFCRYHSGYSHSNNECCQNCKHAPDKSKLIKDCSFRCNEADTPLFYSYPKSDSPMDLSDYWCNRWKQETNGASEWLKS